MKICFTHNLKTSDREEEAEFDTPETVANIAKAIEAAGHEVVPVNCNGSVEALVQKLKEADPDLVFNTAEGSKGRTREAMFPMVFEQLGIPYTGSDAYVLTLTLDKQLTRLAAAQRGVRVARGVFRTAAYMNEEVDPIPCIVKPNFEGSSKGITDASVVTDSVNLTPTLQLALKAYPEGVLVEEFILGVDVTVPYVEGLGSGVLTPCSYAVKPEHQTRHRLYDYKLKNSAPHDAVGVDCPATISKKSLQEVQQMASKAVHALGLRNFARLDFRVRDDGAVFFLEANATPSLQEDSSIFCSAYKDTGKNHVEVIRHIIDNAMDNWVKQGRLQKRAEKARKTWMETPAQP